MNQSRLIALTFLMLLVPVSMSAAEPAPASTVKYRQSLMKVMAGYMNALSLIAKGEVKFQDAAAKHADGLHEISRTLSEAFPVGTGPDKVRSDAKGEIWKSYPAFKQASHKLEVETATLQKVAASHNLKALESQVKAVGRACGECHDKYRVKDE